jgi:hypothetical protein
MCLFYFNQLICLTFMILTITIQHIDDIIILSIHIMIEKVIERVNASAYID